MFYLSFHWLISTDLYERQFEKDLFVDCQDSVKNWLVAVVMDVTDTKVLVHYVDWPSKWYVLNLSVEFLHVTFTVNGVFGFL